MPERGIGSKRRCSATIRRCPTAPWHRRTSPIGRPSSTCCTDRRGPGEFTVDGDPRPLPLSVEELFPAPIGGLIAIQVTPSIRINVFVHGPTELWFDFSTREIEGGGMPHIGTFARELGRATGKAVQFSHEGYPPLVFLTYDPLADGFRLPAREHPQP